MRGRIQPRPLVLQPPRHGDEGGRRGERLEGVAHRRAGVHVDGVLDGGGIARRRSVRAVGLAVEVVREVVLEGGRPVGRERGVPAPERQVVVHVGEAAREPRGRRPEDGRDQLVRRQVGRGDQRKSPVDEEETRHEVGMPMREHHRHERPHGVRDHEVGNELQRRADGGQIVGVRRHARRSLHAVAATATAQVRRDDPHVRQRLGEQLPREVRRGDPVDGEDRRGARLGLPHTDPQRTAGDGDIDGARRAGAHRAVHPPSIV